MRYEYRYDAVGNRVGMTTPAGVVSYEYDAADRLTGVNGVPYTYDANGNLLSDGQRTFTYDAANRLVQVISGTLTTEYAYSGDGVRLAQTVNGQTTRYVNDVAAPLPQVLVETRRPTNQPTNQLTNRPTTYLYGLGLLAQQEAGVWAYHHPDGLGSVRQLTDEAGQVTLARSFAPFGELLSQAGVAPATFGYAGEQSDAASGLIYLRARYYDPATGRFLTRDPYPAYATQPSTLHRYVYVGNNPINRVDPSGLWAVNSGRGWSPQRAAAPAQRLSGGRHRMALASGREAGRPDFFALLRTGPGWTPPWPGAPFHYRAQGQIGPGPRPGGRSYDVTRMMAGRAEALESIYNHYSRALSEAFRRRYCGPTGMPSVDWKDIIQNQGLIPYLLRQAMANPYLSGPVSAQEAKQMALWLGLALGATILTAGAAAPFILAGAVLGAGMTYGAQVYANYRAGLRGPEMWRRVNPWAIVQGGIRGAGIGAITGLIAPLVSMVGSSAFANAVGGAAGQVLGQAVQDIAYQGWGNWSPAQVYLQEALIGAVSGVVAGGVSQLGNAMRLSPVLTGGLAGASAGAASQLLRNALLGAPLGQGVLEMTLAGAAGGMVGGWALGRLPANTGLLPRMLVGAGTSALVGGGMYALTNLAQGRPWHQGVIKAAVVNAISGGIEAATDYWADVQVARARPGGVDTEWRARPVQDPAVRRALDVWSDPGATRAQREWAARVLLDAGVPGVWRGGLPAEGPLRLPVEWDPRAKQWRDPETGRLISLEDARAQGRPLIVDEPPGRVVGIDEAERLSGIPRESLLGAQAVAHEKGVDAFFRDVNPRLGEVAAHTVPKPPGYASPLWKTNEWGYVRNTETGQILVKVSETGYGAFEASQVYDQATGRIYPEFEGQVVGPDIDPYWVHGPEGQIVGETPLDRQLRAQFNEVMGGRITHGQWVEYPGARGPNGPALGVTRRGEFVWLEQREIAAWFAYHGVPYPFSK